MIISIDAHKNKIAAAHFWRDKGLVKVHMVKGTQRELRTWIYDWKHTFWAGRIDVVVIEKMRIYPNERVKNPNDLLEVSKVVGMCHFLGDVVVEYEPREWKGQLPKKTHHDRIKKILSEQEFAILGKYENNEHILDAVGIGLHYLRRS